MPELRRDPIIGRWVIISTERNKRPTDYGRVKPVSEMTPCPFCPGNEDRTPSEILTYGPSSRERDKPGWDVRVVPNKFPCLEVSAQPNRKGEGLYDKMDGLGAHEVIIETPDHDRQLEDLDDKRLEDVFWAYRDRIVDLKKDQRLEYILVFKNRGYAAGTSLSHPHTQLIATPMVPSRVKQEMTGAKAYFDYKERCIFCDIIHQELEQKVRVVDENHDFVALAPYASRFPFETWVLPKKHDYNFEDIQKPEMGHLARIMKSVLRKLNGVLDTPSYNFVIHNSPLKDAHLDYYHWHIEVIPRVVRTAGFEWGTDFYINPTPPERAAAFMREIDGRV